MQEKRKFKFCINLSELSLENISETVIGECCYFLQDMGVLLYHKQAKTLCLNPHVFADVICAFVKAGTKEFECFSQVGD